MDVTTTVLDKADAAAQLEQYRTIKSPDEEERAIIAALVAAAAGKSLVNLREAIVACGSFEDGCPRLAVMGTTWRWCYVTRSTDGVVTYRPDPHTEARDRTFRFGGFPELGREAIDTAHLSDWNLRWRRNARRTQVPIIPPQHRVRGWKTRCVVLWEVEEWQDVTLPRPPGDPMLLRHLIDDFYSVEAVWDLTPLEQLVLGARR